MPIYWKAEPGDAALKLLDAAMQEWHQDLHKHGVRIGVIFALSNKEGVPAVRHAGYPALATMQIVNPKNRVSKGYDAELTIDGDDWKNSTDKHRLALLDHELSHLEIKKPKPNKKKKKPANDEDETETQEPEIVTDDHGRPVLKLRKGDWNVGDGFSEVVARHGPYAVEYRNIEYAKTLADAARREALPIEEAPPAEAGQKSAARTPALAAAT